MTLDRILAAIPAPRKPTPQARLRIGTRYTGSVCGRLAWALAAAAALAAGAAAAADATTGGWRISCNGSADSHGWVVLSFVEGGEAIAEISAPIPKGTPENDVARRVRKALRQALPKDQYRVDVRGGEQVLVTADGHSREFEIGLVRNTATGTEITIARE